MDTPVLACSNLTKRYRNKKSSDGIQVLNGVDLVLQKNEMIAVTGSSGCGKSTLLHLLGGLDQADSGMIRWEMMDVPAMNADQLAKARNNFIGFVFQFHHLLPEFSALENIMMPGLIRGDQKSVVKEKAENWLNRFGLSDRKQHRPSELSGGEQQRIAMARALMNDPPVVLADEPTGNLDEENTERLLELIFELKEELKTSFIIVTHEKEIASRCDHHFLLQNGKLEKPPFEEDHLVKS